MIDEVLPSDVRSAEAFHDEPGTPLFPEEQALITKAVPKRRNEFTTVRHCARKALAELGHPPVPLLKGERGAPRWPTGITGSMTHCAGYRAAAVARRTDFASIGIDAEPAGALPDGVLDTIARPEELVRIRRLETTSTTVHWDRLLFSAKESVYKAWFPLTHRWLDFDEASIDINPVAGTFHAQLLAPAPEVPRQEFHGRWSSRNGLLITAIAHPSTPAEAAGQPA
ncbi:4'-phosphopantetheinyl transferase superfamily protein [Saccharopolyspora sp. NPDC000359]|uniref:4'-phosphopantetheinyl transferase family protein n=1 Tax=Saccharopolyspora sp. NPDC000359 TaxID=3154251 RepID=UPI00332D87E4